MIDFQRTEDEQLLVETAERFASEALEPNERDHEAARVYPDALVSAYDELGFARLGLPESLDGMEVPLASCVPVWSALAAGDPAAPFGLSPLGTAKALAGTPVGSALIAGGERGVIAWSDGIALSGDRVTGTIPWAPQPSASWLVLISPTGVRRIDVAGIPLTHRPCGLQAAGGVEILLDAADSEVIGNGALAAEMIAEARIFTAAVALGAARHAFDYAMQYAQDRVVFGKPVAHHQAIAFQLADCATLLDAADLLLGAAAVHPERTLGVANAYLQAMDAAEHVVDRGVQLLGGHGYLYDHPVEKRMRDVQALGCLYGGTAGARAEAASTVLDASASLEVVQ